MIGIRTGTVEYERACVRIEAKQALVVAREHLRAMALALSAIAQGDLYVPRDSSLGLGPTPALGRSREEYAEASEAYLAASNRMKALEAEEVEGVDRLVATAERACRTVFGYPTLIGELEAALAPFRKDGGR